MDSSIDQTDSMPASATTNTVVKSNASSVADPRYAAYVPALTVGSSSTVTNANSPFYVHTNNAASHKFKYPEAAPTPDGEDDIQWGKIYTAADSRHYNHHNKSSTESKKFRVSGETYTLALKMLVENKQKYATAVQIAIAAGAPIPTDIPRATPKPGSTPRAAPKSEPRSFAKKEQPFTESRGGSELLSISESAKLQSRTARQTSATSSSIFNQTASPSQQEMTPAKKNSPAPGARAKTKLVGTAPTKSVESNSMKRAGETVSKAITKKVKTDAGSNASRDRSRPHSPMHSMHSQGLVDVSNNITYSTTNHWAEKDHGRNSMGEKIYCICRQPDDRTNMIQCSNPVCSEWFHIKCVGFSLHIAEVVVEYFYCENCSHDTVHTTFKRLCRIKAIHDHGFRGMPNCWNLARVDEGSKYCSDEHATMFWKHIFKHELRLDTESSIGGRLNVQELGNLIKSSSTVEMLKNFGGKPSLLRRTEHDPSLPVGADYIKDEEGSLIVALRALKDQCAEHYDHVAKMATFLRMVEARAIAAASYLGVDVNSVCGYDKRLAMNEEQFSEYSKSAEAIAYFESGVLGPATEDASKYTESISYGSIDVISGCELPEALRNICLEQWVHNYKSKKNCKHNTVGSIWWRNKYWEELRYKRHLLNTSMDKYDKLIEEIYDQAEDREITQPLYDGHVTETFD